MREEDGVVFITPHSFGCPELRRIVAVRNAGWCPQCGAELIVKQRGLEIYCPAGCSYELRGEAAVDFFDATGDGWIREVLKES